jgi:glycosyltransferase involved in cell wall biosynthesis
MRILFYSPFNHRARDAESVMLALHRKGHEVISLTQAEGYLINDFLRSCGIEAHAHPLPGRKNFLFYSKQLIFLIRFCREHRIDVVFSHLDPANFVASVAQYFMTASVFLFRHHIDEAALYDYAHNWSYRLTNLLAKKIIVVSKRAAGYMIAAEKVPARKISQINLSYDFSLYKPVDEEIVRGIRNQYPCKLLLITVCRLTTFKRPQLSIEVVRQLRKSGIDARLLILGNGEMREELEETIRRYELSSDVFLTGHVSNVLDYLAAGDVVIHPSVLESSCVVVKEAGLVSKPVIVCRNIGDFDDYIRDEWNGFVVDQNAFVEQSVKILSRFDPQVGRKLGENLRSEVLKNFDIEKTISRYIDLIQNIQSNVT